MNHREKTSRLLNRIVIVTMITCILSTVLCIASAGAFFVQASISTLNIILVSGALAVVSLLLWDALDTIAIDYEELIDAHDVCLARIRTNNNQC